VPSASASPSGSATTNQLSYQLGIQDERGALKGGTAFAASALSANTDHAIPFNAVICGATSERCQRPPTVGPSTEAAAPAGLPPRLGDVHTGARIRAKLTTADATVAITELASDATQPIIADNDAAEWEWSIKPSAEGQFALSLRIDVLETASERLLVPSQLFRITLKVTTTTGDRFRGIGADIWDFVASVTGLIATIGGAGLFTSIAWVWRRVRRRRTPVAPIAPPS
jgi:hypothetical protein